MSWHPSHSDPDDLSESRAVPVVVHIEGNTVKGEVRIFTTPETMAELEHDMEVTANFDGIFLSDGRHVSTLEIDYFDFLGERP